MSTDTIYNWSTTADTNATADEEIEWSEYQAASTVNNSARAMMRRVAQLIRDLGPNATSTGTVNAYAVTSAATAGGAALNDGEIIEFIPHITNTSTSTLNKDSKGAVPLRPKSGTEFGAGQIIAGVPIKATYRQSSNEWIVTNPAAYVFAQLAPSYLASNTFGIKVGDVKLSVSATPDAGFVRLTETAQALSKTAYPDLNSWASAQGYPWGSASTTFNVPPAGGYFLRFAASGSSVDTSGARTPGSTQSDQNKAHTHTVSGTGTTSTDGAHTHTYSKYNDLTGQGSGSVVSWRNVTTDTTSSSGSHSHTVTVTGTAASDGGDEARVKNVAMHADMLAVPALVASGLIGVGGLAYKFSSVTTATDPGAGFFQINNATPSSATAFYINETDANGASLASVIQAIPSGSQLYITKVGAPANYIAATVSSTATDNGAWNSFVLSACSYQGTISNGDTVSIVVMRSGSGSLSGMTSHGVVIATGTTSATSLTVAGAGTVLAGVSSSDPAFTATPTLGVSGATLGTLALAGNTSGTTTVQPAAAASGTLTLPAATDTLVGKATTDTLTNKTFDTAGTGNVFKVNGTQISDKTGAGKAVLDTSPTLVTPTLGVASATSVNKVAITAPASGSTLTIADGKTLTANASLTLTGTDSTTMTFPATSSSVLTTGNTATITKGFAITPYNIGTVSSGTTTLDPANGNYQYYTNNGAHTIAAPSSDCAIDILLTNGASAGTITFSGFTAPSGGGGDTYATTNANKYIMMVRRINGTTTYSFKALQ